MPSTIESLGGVEALIPRSSGLFGGLVAALPGAAGGSVSFGPDAIVSIAGLGAGAASADSIIAAAYGPRAAAPRPPQAAAREAATIKQANFLTAGGDYAAARSLLSDYARDHGASGAVARAQGLNEQTAGDYDKAEQYFRKAAALDPTLGAEVDAENARSLRGNDADVLARVRRLQSSAATSAAGDRLLGTLLTRSPRNVEARLVAARQAEQSANPVRAFFQYSQALAAASDAEVATLEKDFERLVARSSTDAFARNLLGRAQLRLGKFDTALESLHAAAQLAQGDLSYATDEARAHVAIGRRQLERGDVTQALESFQRALDLDSTLDEARLGRGSALEARARQRAMAGDYTRAITDYEAAARDARAAGGEELRGRIARDVYAVGRRLEARRIDAGGEIGAEVTAFQAAYDIDPSSSVYRRKLAETRFALGDQFTAAGKHADAAAAYRRALELYKSNTTYRDAAISALRLDGGAKLASHRYDDAISAFKSAYELKKSDETSKSQLADTYNRAGLYYRAIGETSRAASYFQNALSLYPDNEEYRSNRDSVG